MKVGFISQWFPPERGSAALPGTLTDALVDEGMEVRVLTGFPNYPDGTLQPGWRQHWNHMEMRGATPIFRTPIYVSHDGHALRRMANYLSFALSATITGVRRMRGIDVVWVHGTPALAAVPAMVLKWIFGVPYVLHIQDLWPDTVLASGMLPKRIEAALRPLLGWFCQLTYSQAAVIGIIAPGMKEALISRGVPSSKIVDIPNWADESIFSPVDNRSSVRKELGLPTGFVAMYAGAMGEVQGLDTLIRAADQLTDRDDVVIAFVGDGTAKEHLQSLTQELDCSNVVFVPAQPLEQMSAVLSAADIQVICLKDLPLYRITLPSKVQATLAAGRPVIVSAGGDAGAVATSSGAGFSVPPGNSTELAEAIRRAADADPEERAGWGRAARDHYVRHFSQQRGVAKMVEALSTAYCLRKGEIQ